VTSLTPSDGQVSIFDDFPAALRDSRERVDKVFKARQTFSSNVSNLNTPSETVTEAIDRAGEHADQSWVRDASRIVRELCETHSEFTADDLWERLDLLEVSTKEPRALASVLLKASKLGLCRVTDRVQVSRRAICRRRRISIWRSLLVI
jgi:hypothetical protein